MHIFHLRRRGFDRAREAMRGMIGCWHRRARALSFLSMAKKQPPADLPAQPAPPDPSLPPVTPDLVEQEMELDNIVPTRGYQLAPVVGLGGSAGSIPPLREFFHAVPADTGLSFVVILHLSPTHESNLPEIIQGCTRMQVLRAEDGMSLDPNCVYVIPPGKVLQTGHGRLRAADAPLPRTRHVAVDLFFRSLADTHGPHAAGIVFSGADGDGALGIKRIKERGGLTIAQDPAEAEHPSMPRSAMETGMIDWVLRAAEMPQRLVTYYENERRLQLPAEEGPQPARVEPVPNEEREAALRDVLVFLRTRTGHDFSYYKRATILRRISRRMQVNGIEDLPGYLSYLRLHPGEAAALLQDLLISVTNFFRDRDAFEALEQQIPAVFDGKGPDAVVRVWIAACATGEEAYSVAMLLLEHARKMDAPPSIQLFACDLDAQAIQIARAGFYPLTIAADVSEERLRRFFVKEHRGYRVRRELRELVLFAAHDLLKDPPFSRMDLISCRNLLIYLTREAQQRCLETFHFALQPNGCLFLGSSESVDETSELFAPVDKKHRIFRQIPARRTPLPLPIGPNTLLQTRGAPEPSKNLPVMLGPGFDRRDPPGDEASAAGSNPGLHSVSLAELHFRLIERFAPPSVIVNQNGEIVHLSENVGRFMQLAGGEPSTSLLRVIHPSLRVELRAALFRASESGLPVESLGIPATLDGAAKSVDLRVMPAGDLAPGYQLVIFDAIEPGGAAKAQPRVADSDPLVRHLERELDSVNASLRDKVEQFEAGTEELKASNEELQAMNEELRSATEELETSREELQSTNEELTTVNQELKLKVDELGSANSDLHNLMSSTAIATLFLDRELRVMRYTPPAVALFNLIPTDLGRPLADLSQRVHYPELPVDAQRVLEQLVSIEREVRDAENRWFLARLLPYRSLDDRISGVVLTFIEITERKLAEEALRRSEQRLAAIFSQAAVGLAEISIDGRFERVNAELCRMLGRSQPEMLGLSMTEVTHPDDLPACLAAIERVTKSGEADPFDKRCLHRDGSVVWVNSTLTRMEPSADQPGRVLAVIVDLTARRAAETALSESQERLRLIIENAREYAIFTLDLDRRVTSWNVGAERLLAFSEAEIIGKSGDVIFTEEDRAAGVPEQEARTAAREGRASDERWHVRKDGSRFWGSGAMMAMHDAKGAVVGLVKIFQDQTAAREAQQELEQSRQELWEALQENERARAEVEAAAAAKDQFFAILSHELRTPLTPVLMAAHSLKKRRDLPADVIEIADMIRRNIQLEAHFIDDLLDVTRISRGKLEITREPLDFHAVTTFAVEVVRPDFIAKAQNLTVRLDATEHRIVGDSSRLQQGIWNLLKNASKFTPAQGLITVRTRNTPGKIVLEVADTGIGIELEAMPRIFEPFSQGSEAVTREYGGLGLGLAIAKATAEAHGGSLRVESAGKDHGSVFILELPLAHETTE
jgi:two-component system, chemotaxis family, CheB/CheR fusion protein